MRLYIHRLYNDTFHVIHALYHYRAVHLFRMTQSNPTEPRLNTSNRYQICSEFQYDATVDLGYDLRRFAFSQLLPSANFCTNRLCEQPPYANNSAITTKLGIFVT